MTNSTTKSTFTMPSMPAMPSKAKSKPIHPCACGCGAPTKSMWASGHDGRATGWAIRVERGIMKLEEVPANERKGCEIMLARHAKATAAEQKTA